MALTDIPLRVVPLPPQQFPETWALLEKGIVSGVAPGIVAGIWLASDPNTAWIAQSGREIRFDTVFDLSSVSKVMATSALIGRLVDRGLIRFSDPLRNFFPEYPEYGIELHHLLSHTSGLPAWAPVWQTILSRSNGQGLDKISIQTRQNWAREFIFSIAPERPVGEKAVYSDLSFMLLGFVLEAVTRMPLDAAVRKYVWSPMGLNSAFYRRLPGLCPVPLERVAPTESCPWRKKTLQGEVHDDNCWAMGGYAGHAGVFSDALGVLGFARASCSGYLSSPAQQAMWKRVSVPAAAGCERTLGWDTPSGAEPAASRLFSQDAVGHLGFTGTSLWIEPRSGIAVTLLSNRVNPTRGEVGEIPKIRAFRPLIHEAMRRELGR